VGERQVIKQAYRFALAPSPDQEEFLSACAGASRFYFNQALAVVKERLDQRVAGAEVSVPWSYKELCSELDHRWRADVAPWQPEVACGAYQAGFEALGKALQNFTQARRQGRRVGFPRFRKRGRCTESVIFQRPRLLDVRHIALDNRIGPVRSKERLTKLHRLLRDDENARILRSTISRSNGKWFISFAVERSPKLRSARRPAAVVGVDVGLTRLATLSTAEAFANSRPLQEASRKLRRLQQQLDRQRRAGNPDNYSPDGKVKPGRKEWRTSGRMARTQERARRLHERVANLRGDQAHKLTTGLTREFGVIGVETVAVSNMLKNRRLARQISDVGWGTVLQQLAYKTGWAGSTLVAADRYYPSSKTCSFCGLVKAKLGLSERVFTCDNAACGLVLDRDLNAAANLARMAEQHAQSEGLDCHVAAAGAETLNARRGQVRPLNRERRSPVKREAFPEATQRREALAIA